MEKQILKWLEKGLINEEISRALIEDSKEEAKNRKKFGMIFSLYLIGVIFIGSGVLTFLSFNDWILDLFNDVEILKVLILLFMAVITFCLGYNFSRKNEKYPKLGQALIGLSTVFMGAMYFIAADIYKIDSPMLPALLWGITILPAAYIFKDKFTNFFAMCALIVSIFASFDLLHLKSDDFIYFVYAPLFVSALLYLTSNLKVLKDKYGDFAETYKITALNIAYVVFMILTFDKREFNTEDIMVCAVPIVLLLLGFILNLFFKQEETSLFKVENIFYILVLSGLLTTMFVPDINEVIIVVLANLLIIALLSCLIYFGHQLEKTQLIKIGYLMFYTYILVCYAKYASEYMNAVPFFILAGVLFIALGLIYEKKIKKITEINK